MDYKTIIFPSKQVVTEYFLALQINGESIKAPNPAEEMEQS